MNRTCFIYSSATAMLSATHGKSSTAPLTGKGKMHRYIKKQLMGNMIITE